MWIKLGNLLSLPEDIGTLSQLNRAEQNKFIMCGYTNTQNKFVGVMLADFGMSLVIY